MLRAQIENLYVDAMVLADEAYAAFAAAPDSGPFAISAADRVGLVCEQLKTSTRLMHIIAWILHHRARLAGEAGVTPGDAAARLDDVAPSDPAIAAQLPPASLRIVAESEALFARVQRLDAELRGQAEHVPVHRLLRRIDQFI